MNKDEYALDELIAKRDSYVFNHNNSELKRLFTTDSLGARLVFSLTFGASRKLVLLKEGFISLALCYITFEEEEEKDRVLGNVIFSPKEGVDLLEVYRKIERLYDSSDSHKDRRTKILLTKLFSPLHLTKYLELPREYTNDELVYASHILFTKNTFMPTKPGLFLVPILHKKSLSSYIIPLPKTIFS